MAVLVTAIHDFIAGTTDADGRNKSGHDDTWLRIALKPKIISFEPDRI